MTDFHEGDRVVAVLLRKKYKGTITYIIRSMVGEVYSDDYICVSPDDESIPNFYTSSNNCKKLIKRKKVQSGAV